MTLQHSKWKSLLLLAGLPGILAPAYLLDTHRSDIACGIYVGQRWALPYFAILSAAALVGLALVIIAIFTSEDRARSLAQGLIMMLVSTGLMLVLIDTGMRLTEPPRRQDRFRYEQHDTLGYFTAPHIHFDYESSQNEFVQQFTTDDRGLILGGHIQPYTDESTRIMFIGDSFVAGWQVTSAENMSSQAARNLRDRGIPDVAAINLGMNGYSPIHYKLVYDVFADEFDPDLVIVVVFVGNDFRDSALLVEGNDVVIDQTGEYLAITSTKQDNAISRAFSGVRDEAGHPYLVPPEIWQQGILLTTRVLVYEPLCQTLEQQMNGPQIYDFRSPPQLYDWETGQDCFKEDNTPACNYYPTRNDMLIGQNNDAIFKDRYLEDDLAEIGYSLDALRQLQDHVEADDRRLILVIMPEANQLPDQAIGIKPQRGLQPHELIDSTAPQDLLKTFCAEHNLICLDLLPVFQQHVDQQLYWVYDTHLTPLGHAIAGEAIADYVYSLGLITSLK